MPEEMDAFDLALFELVKGEVLKELSSGLRDNILRECTRRLADAIIQNLTHDHEVIYAMKGFTMAWFEKARDDALRERKAANVQDKTATGR